MERNLQERVREALARTIPMWPDFFREAFSVPGLADLTMLQLGVLAAACESPRVDALPVLLGCGAEAVDGARHELERRGLVARTGDTLALSPDGRRLFDGMLTSRVTAIGTLYDLLPPEDQRRLVEYVERLAGAVDRTRVPEGV